MKYDNFVGQRIWTNLKTPRGLSSPSEYCAITQYKKEFPLRMPSVVNAFLLGALLGAVAMLWFLVPA